MIPDLPGRTETLPVYTVVRLSHFPCWHSRDPRPTFYCSSNTASDRWISLRLHHRDYWTVGHHPCALVFSECVFISSLPCHRGEQRKLLPSKSSTKYHDQFKIYPRNPSCQCPAVPQTCWNPEWRARNTADQSSQRQWEKQKWVPPSSARSGITVTYL